MRDFGVFVVLFGAASAGFGLGWLYFRRNKVVARPFMDVGLEEARAARIYATLMTQILSHSEEMARIYRHPAPETPRAPSVGDDPGFWADSGPQIGWDPLDAALPPFHEGLPIVDDGHLAVLKDLFAEGGGNGQADRAAGDEQRVAQAYDDRFGVD